MTKITVLLVGVELAARLVSASQRLFEGPGRETRQLPDDIGREHEKQHNGVARPNGAVQGAVESGKTAAVVFSKYRLADEIDGERQDQQASKQKAQE